MRGKEVGGQCIECHIGLRGDGGNGGGMEARRKKTVFLGKALVAIIFCLHLNAWSETGDDLPVDLQTQLLQNNAVVTVGTAPASGLAQMFLAGLCEAEQVLQLTAVFHLLRWIARRLMLFDDVDVHHGNGTEAHVMCEPKPMDESLSVGESVDDGHDFLGGPDAFANIGGDARLRNIFAVI